MTNLIIDTSVLLAYFDASEPDHAAVAEALAANAGLTCIGLVAQVGESKQLFGVGPTGLP